MTSTLLDSIIISAENDVAKIKRNKRLPGAGFIVFRKTYKSTYQVLLVISKKNNYGFPKGCPEKYDKNNLDTAYRELQEETGIDRIHIVLSKILPFFEKKEKLCKNTKEKYVKLNYYFIAFLQPVFFDVELTYDTHELVGIGWFDIDEAVKLLEIGRANILKNAFETFIELAKNQV
jgi:8-oxo-dGTP pyrophosphatase MutT (NUDIX family)